MKYCIDCHHYKADTTFCLFHKLPAFAARANPKKCNTFGKNYSEKDRAPTVIVWTVFAFAILVVGVIFFLQ